ncbi:MAG: tetratricopeptide repeat protein [Deltaproteobacteria bacterium]|nr:tetratricopeptide repeat protein [Deltaproteobacteria bacterium]
MLANETIDLIEKKQYEKAEENCRKLLQDFPDYVDGHAKYGDLYSATGQFEKAIDSYEKAIQHMKTNPGFDKEIIECYQEIVQDLKGKL